MRTKQVSRMNGDQFEEDFECGESGASATYPRQCSSLRKNGHVLLKSHPCKIVEMSTSKTGKHGHAKVHLTGIDIFTGNKYEDICPSTHNMEVPNVTRKDYQVNDIDDEGYMTLMDDNCGQRSDLKVPTGVLGEEILNKFNEEDQIAVTVLKAMGQEVAVGVKVIS